MRPGYQFRENGVGKDKRTTTKSNFRRREKSKILQWIQIFWSKPVTGWHTG